MENTISITNYINNNLRLFPEIGNVIPYDDFCESLFGSTINDIPRMELLNKGYVTNSMTEEDKTLYFKLSKLESFIKFSTSRVNFNSNNICPINFLSLLELVKFKDESISSVDVSDKHVKIINLLKDFKKFLEQKDDINSKAILKSYWDSIFKGVITSSNENPLMITFKFTKRNSFPYILNIVEYQLDTKNTLCLNSIGEKQIEEFEKLYENWEQEMLMDNVENYVTSCLEAVTGSIDLAKMIFSSHEQKSNFIINVEDLNIIINFKSKNKKIEYLNLFKKLYQSNNIYQEEDNKLYLNFEGFNKYLLNMELSYLVNFQDKENINELYYNIMDELVNSYKRLYKYTKLI